MDFLSPLFSLKSLCPLRWKTGISPNLFGFSREDEKLFSLQLVETSQGAKFRLSEVWIFFVSRLGNLGWIPTKVRNVLKGFLFLMSFQGTQELFSHFLGRKALKSMWALLRISYA